MTPSSSNPWAARFEPLLNAETIRTRAALSVEPLVGLHDLPCELALKRLEVALTTAFYPTTQCVAVLLRLVGIAHAHCLTTYIDRPAFLHAIYSGKTPLPLFAYPTCLTGPAGTGKTSLVNTFLRLVGLASSILVDSNHSPFPLTNAWLLTVQARADPRDVLAQLAGRSGKPSELVEECRSRAYREGVPITIGDEFQFATGSSSANARVTQMLLSLAYIGIPLVFVANYSLLLRLMKRPEEDQQRLLADPIVILPDPWHSADWSNTLEAQRDVAPEILQFDPRKDAQRLHELTAGRKRAMKNLILIAFRMKHPSRGVVKLDALQRAYDSPQFARFREEAEILASQAARNAADPKRKDLWCPIPLPPDEASKALESAKKARDGQVADAELLSSLSAEQRRAVHSIEKANKSTKRNSGNIVSLGKRRQKPSGDELKRNAAWLREKL